MRDVLNGHVTDAEEVSGGEGRTPFVLAIDIGTSSVRAAFYDARARRIAGSQARIEHEFGTTADGGAEVDADEAVAEVVRVVDAALMHGGEATAARARAVVVSSFWHSLVGVDEDGRAVTPVFGWADTRAAAEAGELRQGFDERATHARTGCRFHPSYWPAKLRWLQKTRAAIFHARTRWMSFADFLALRLSGDWATSVSMASGTGLFDQRRCRWDDELVAALGLQVEQLPALAGTRATFAVGGRYAQRWPTLRACAWHRAIGDGAANNIGAGCTTPERAALMVGTSGAMRVMWRGDVPAEIPGGLWCYRADSERVVVGGALSDGGGLHAWMSETLALDDDKQAVERALATMKPDAHGLTLLPFWAGERSTGWHAHTSGAVLGLTTHTRPADVLRASMEAVAYRFALIADALKPFAPATEIRASGGALRASATWRQIVADVLGRPLALSLVREASSRGAVLLALEAAGEIQSLADVPTPTDDLCRPDASRHARYRKGLERQRKVYELLIENQDIAAMLGEAGQSDSQDRQDEAID